MAPMETRRLVPGSDTALLCIHGILSTPVHFHFLSPAVPSSWSVVNILLKGHGQGVEDLSAASMAAWRAQVKHEADSLLATHRHLVILAHSMGTLFAIEAAIAHPDRVTGLFLLAPALRPRPRPQAADTALRVGFSLGNQQLPRVAANRRAYSIRSDRRWWLYAGWVPRYLELFALMGEVRQQLPRLTVPTVAIHSRQDELVSPRSALYLGRCPEVTQVWLPHSGHHCYDPVDRQTICRLFEGFVKRCSTADG